VKIAFKDILPNPNRDLKGNPLREDKITELIVSINTTGFWDNVVVRKNKAGKYELAYGHHRMEACKRAGLLEADFIIKKISDEKMIQMMDQENRDTYAASTASVLESVRAVVLALAAGSITPFEIDKKTPSTSLRYAPSFVPGKDVISPTDQIAYTTLGVAQFLGRTFSTGKGNLRLRAEDYVATALDALHLLEIKRLSAESFYENSEPITMKKLKVVCDSIKQNIKREEDVRKPEAQKVAEETAKQVALDKLRHEEEEKVHKAQLEITRLKALENKAKNDKEAAERLKERERQQAKEARRAIESKIAMAAVEARLEKRKQDRLEKERNATAAKEQKATSTAVEALAHAIQRVYVNASAISEQAKSVASLKNLTMAQRNTLYKEAQAAGEWFSGWLSSQFVAPLSGLKLKVTPKGKK
jgi:ParB-like nuclease domain